MVSTLLRGGADPTLLSELALIPPAGPFPPPSQFRGPPSNRILPMNYAYYFAICGDHADVLRSLYDWEARGHSGPIHGEDSQASPLFHASKVGAKRCFLYMLQKHDENTLPHIVNSTDNEGRTPLQCAVQRGGGTFFVEKLIYHGARLDHPDRSGRKVLHLLFAVDGRLHPEFYPMTQLLLDCGGHRYLNAQDQLGYTPLLLLLHRLNSCWNAENVSKASNDDVKRCVELMLTYGADPNIRCSRGHSALDVILRRNLFHYTSPLRRARVRSDVSGIEVILDVLRLLIEKGSADVNPQTLRDGHVTPLNSWLFSLQSSNVTPRELMIISDVFTACLDLLLLNGADPNARPAVGGLSVLSIVALWTKVSMNRGSVDDLIAVLPVVKVILERLFRRNARILSISPQDSNSPVQLHNTYQEILGMCYNAFTSEQMTVVNFWLTTLMSWGIQAELYLPPSIAVFAPPIRGHDDAVRRHFLFQFLLMSLFLELCPGYERTLRLVCNYVDGVTMRSCLDAALQLFQERHHRRDVVEADGEGSVDGGARPDGEGSHVEREGGVGGAIPREDDGAAVDDGDRAAADDLENYLFYSGQLVHRSTRRTQDRMIEMIMTHLSTTESLQVLARKAIVKSLNGKMALKVPRLKLPSSMKDYLLDFAQS